MPAWLNRLAPRRAMLAAVATLALAAPASAALLVNGDFNTDANADGTPDGWSNWSYGTTAFTAYVAGSNSFARDATPFVNAGNYGAWWSSGGGWYQVVAGVAGHAYVASIDSGTEAWDNMNAELRLIYLDASNGVLRTDTRVVADYEPNKPWATYTVAGTAPAGTTQVKLEVATNGARGSALFDNASLADLDAAVPEPTSLAALAGAGVTLLRRRRR